MALVWTSNKRVRAYLASAVSPCFHHTKCVCISYIPPSIKASIYWLYQWFEYCFWAKNTCRFRLWQWLRLSVAVEGWILHRSTPIDPHTNNVWVKMAIGYRRLYAYSLSKSTLWWGGWSPVSTVLSNIWYWLSIVQWDFYVIYLLLISFVWR